MEIGITGGEEDGVCNENVDNDKLYTSPEQVITNIPSKTLIGGYYFRI